MDGGTALICWSIFVAMCGFSAGRYTPLADVKTDCASKGEIIIQKTIVKCKPIGALVDGKRIMFTEQ